MGGDPSASSQAAPAADQHDRRLLAAVAMSDERALAELYARHGRSVYGLARRLLGDGAEAEDITQELFVHLWEHPDRFEPARGSLRTYLLTRTHSRAVDAIRSRSARLRREERDARGVAGVAVDVDVEGQVVQHAAAASVARALSLLAPAERAAIELAYYGGHSYREVAELLSEPEGTVKSRIRKGLQRLRALVEEVEGHDGRRS